MNRETFSYVVPTPPSPSVRVVPDRPGVPLLGVPRSRRGSRRRGRAVCRRGRCVRVSFHALSTLPVLFGRARHASRPFVRTMLGTVRGALLRFKHVFDRTEVRGAPLRSDRNCRQPPIDLGPDRPLPPEVPMSTATVTAPPYRRPVTTRRPAPAPGPTDPSWPDRRGPGGARAGDGRGSR